MKIESPPVENAAPADAPPPKRADTSRSGTKRRVRTALKVIVVAMLTGFFPKTMALFIVCGVYDLGRNSGLTVETAQRYFLGNGALTWALSPFNVLLDLLALPHLNKGIYRLRDLPAAHRAEIERLIEASRAADLVGQLERRVEGEARSMIFFKWYGAPVETFVDVPAFREPYRFIETIGVSVFNRKQSTSEHFGPFRPTLRVLYNLNDMKDRSAFIKVGDTVQYWMDEKLFIFDDTLQHRSFNESDAIRYCLFVDIVRPAALPQLLKGVVTLIRWGLGSVNFIFYKNWKVIGR